MTTAAVKLTKAQLDELKRLATGPQPSYGKGRVRVHNNLRRHGLASIDHGDGFVCTITPEGRAFLVDLVGWSRHVAMRSKPLEADVIDVKEIGKRINTHLKRFEADPKINLDRSPNKTGLHTYYNSHAIGSRGRVYVAYISYQGQTVLKKADALKYLAWLDAGNVGTHYKALR